MEAQQEAAYIMSQTACALVEAFGMVAENQDRLSQGKTIAYGEEAFQGVIDKYGLWHNNVISFFHGGV